MLADKLPEPLAGDREHPLSRRHALDEIKHRLLFIQERIRVFDERLDGVHGTLQALHVEVSVAEVIWLQCNGFGDSQPMPEGHQKHQEIALPFSLRGGEKGE